MINYLNLNSFTFSITDYCGCKCKHCLVDSGTNKRNFLNKDIILKVCKEIKSLNILSNDEPIALTGGEISFHPQIIDIIQEIKKLNFKKVNINLTGMAFNEDNIKKIAPLINIACFSIDGPSEFHDNFRGVNIYMKTLKNINLFKKYGTKNIAIQMSILKENMKYIDEIAQLANFYGVDHLRLVPVLPIGRAQSYIDNNQLLNQSDYDELLKKVIFLNGKFIRIDTSSLLDRRSFLLKNPQKVYGIESITNIEVNQEGNVFFNGFVNNTFCIGNIKENSLKKILNDFLKGEKYSYYNKISKDIYCKEVINGNKETICVYKSKLCY